MIAPYELKNKTFSRTVRGYNPVEVDEYFDFLIDKYTEVYKSLTELEQKYNSVQSKYDELSNEEESIRSAILKAQKLGEVIVGNAKRDADAKEAELQERCDRILDEARAKVQEEKDNLIRLRESAAAFQHKLYEDYVRHVEMIRSMKLDEEIDGDQVIVAPAEEALVSAKESVLNGPGPDILTGTSDNHANN